MFLNCLEQRIGRSYELAARGCNMFCHWQAYTYVGRFYIWESVTFVELSDWQSSAIFVSHLTHQWIEILGFQNLSSHCTSTSLEVAINHFWGHVKCDSKKQDLNAVSKRLSKLPKCAFLIHLILSYYPYLDKMAWVALLHSA